MPDQDDQLQDNDLEQRNDSFAATLGVERWFYLQAIRATVAFTNAAFADPGVRPWRQWGARNIGGRTRALVQNPLNTRQIYAGTSQGGVFRTDDYGDTWHSLGLPGDSFPVGAMGICARNPNIVYVGTGEPAIIHDTPFPSGAPVTRAGREAAAAGVGFFRYDAGTNLFTNEVGPAIPLAGAAAGAANSYAAIAVDPANADRCWIASHTGLWRREAGAVRFQREPVPNAPPAPPALGACISDVILQENWDPNRPNAYRLFAAVAGVGIYRGVYDPAAAPPMTWEAAQLGNGLPAAGTLASYQFDRIRLAHCRNFPNHIYAIMENFADKTIRSIFHSTDGGDHWAACSVPPNLGTQGWSDLCIAVHPDNPLAVIVGNVNLARTLDGGANWQLIIDWQNFTIVDRAQHGDQHTLMFDFREPNRLWVGNDGGISSTPDVVNFNPLVDRTWRKRSNGLCVSQFNDVTSHPNYPFMVGGGLQDNGTYVTFGGPTWMLVGDADGGQMAFELNTPRQYLAPNQGNSNRFNLNLSVVAVGSSVEANPNRYPFFLRSSIPEQSTPPNDVFSTRLSQPAGVPAGMNGLFVQNVIHHPQQANALLAGRNGDVASSANGGVNWVAGGAGAIVGGNNVSALAYAPGATAAASDWWIGDNNGNLVRGGGGALAKVWSNVTPPVVGGLAGFIFTCVAVHPANINYVVAATGGNGGGNVQGRVFLSNDQGAHWMDITGLAAASVLGGPPPGAVAGTLRSLPPCPITSLAFDPSVAAANPQVLYAGTLAGVYVIRNLPRLPVGPPPPIAPPAAFNPDWHTFIGPANAPLPLTLVNDLEIVTLPARPGAIANSPESVSRLRLYAAMYGRGIFVCDISSTYPAGVAPGGPAKRLFIRQHVIEDGLAYPRPTPTLMNTLPAAPSYNNPQMGGDPRMPAIANPVPVPPPASAFNDLGAIDIRVDHAPFQYVDVDLDGVEFDEDLRTKNLLPGQLNVIYVQVQNAGWDTFTQPVDVHLYFAPANAPAAAADPAPLPDLHDNFWANFAVEPQLPPAGTAPAGNVAQWQRAGTKKQSIPANRLSANNPAVVRFEWVVPSNLGKPFVGLLAVCTNPEDALPAPGALPQVMVNLLRQERRAAFRLVQLDPYLPDVYVRDSIDDTGLSASGAAAGRSPDIIVVQAPEADPNTKFADLLDAHEGDRIRPGNPQTIYVRVFNRRAVPVNATVDLFWTRPNAATVAPDPHAPAFIGTTWTRVKPTGTANVVVPGASSALASITWQADDVPAADNAPNAYNAVGLIAIVSSAEGTPDAAPPATEVFDTASFWRYFQSMSASNNAAFRVVLYGE